MVNFPTSKLWFASSKKMVWFDAEEKITSLLWTGLRDVNDKPICPGDILQCDDSAIGGFVGRCTVSYVYDLTLVPAPGYYSFTITGGCLSQQFPFNREIIGNIFENKDLL